MNIFGALIAFTIALLGSHIGQVEAASQPKISKVKLKNVLTTEKNLRTNNLNRLNRRFDSISKSFQMSLLQGTLRQKRMLGLLPVPVLVNPAISPSPTMTQPRQNQLVLIKKYTWTNWLMQIMMILTFPIVATFLMIPSSLKSIYYMLQIARNIGILQQFLPMLNSTSSSNLPLLPLLWHNTTAF